MQCPAQPEEADAGMVSAFLLASVVGLLALAGLSLDGGLALATKVHSIGQAEEAARAGAQHIDLATYRATGTVQLDPAAAQTAAAAFLAAENAQGTVTIAGNAVTVHITAHRRTQLLGLVGIRDLTVTATGTAAPEGGITGIGR